ncbi:MAG: Gfo/Idh/MocA family oxidoreductase, partial [Verrucomicrobiota bacterium]|nr:Gfo/Idh/MocA family oxidoreductase [Verrucomicrobiota bacterium]
MKRRSFLAQGATATVGMPQLIAAREAPRRKIRVGVIGHTGRGDYGHALDTVWSRIRGADVVGVADPDEAGRQRAVQRLKAKQGFQDHHQLLKATEPEFVSICPRYADQHADMMVACAAAGVRGIYVEKPFCRTPAEADHVREVCQKHGTRVAVAHRNRYNPALKHIATHVAEGGIGKLLEIRGRGKGDRRGGAEDLWVLGSHVMDMIRFFA